MAGKFAEHLTSIPEHDYSYTQDTLTAKRAIKTMTTPVLGLMFSAAYWSLGLSGSKTPDYNTHKEEIKSGFSKIVTEVNGMNIAELQKSRADMSERLNEVATRVFNQEPSEKLNKAFDDYKSSFPEFSGSKYDPANAEHREVESAGIDGFKDFRFKLVQAYFSSKKSLTPSNNAQATSKQPLSNNNHDNQIS